MNFRKLIVGAFIILSIKNVPFSYLIQFYLRIGYNLLIQRGKYTKNGRKNTFNISSENDKLALFTSTTFKTYVSPLEIDMYLHKSNSTYLIDLDLARTDVVTKVLQKAFLDSYDNVGGEFKTKSLQNMPYVPVASITCSFKKELKVFQRYNIISRIFAWDEKWVFVLSKFVLPHSDKICALAVTKYVFKKKQRITIKPEDMFSHCNLLTDESIAANEVNYELVKHLKSSEDLELIADRLK